MVPRCHRKPESLTEEYILAASRLDCKIQGVLGEMWREACDRGTRLRFAVASGSMKPLIQVGDVLMVSKVRPHQIHIGDIVAFQDAQNVVVHRIIGKSLSDQQLTFRHMGDAGASSGKIAAQNLIGRVAVIEKEGCEIRLDSRRYIMSSRILGWRLKIVDSLGRMKYRRIGTGLHLAIRPIWRLCQNLLIWRL